MRILTRLYGILQGGAKNWGCRISFDTGNTSLPTAALSYVNSHFSCRKMKRTRLILYPLELLMGAVVLSSSRKLTTEGLRIYFDYAFN